MEARAGRALEVASFTLGPVAQRETACLKPQRERPHDPCLTRPAWHLNFVPCSALPPVRVQLLESSKPLGFLGEGEGLVSVSISLVCVHSCV